MNTVLVRHDMLLMRTKDMLEKAGFRVVVVGNRRGRTPDLIGLKDGHLYQVEIESEKRSMRNLMKRIDRQYDFVMFFTKGPSGSSGQVREVSTLDISTLPPEKAASPVSKPPREIQESAFESHRLRLNETELGHVWKGLDLLKKAKVQGLDEQLVDSLMERLRRPRAGGAHYRGE